MGAEVFFLLLGCSEEPFGLGTLKLFLLSTCFVLLLLTPSDCLFVDLSDSVVWATLGILFLARSSFFCSCSRFSARKLLITKNE